MTDGAVTPLPELAAAERHRAYEIVPSPERVPLYGLVPVHGPRGELLDTYRGVQRLDTQEVVSVVSDRYGLVGHRDVALAVHQVGAALAPPEGLQAGFPREQIRLYSGGRKLEVKVIVGQKFHLAQGEDFYPGLRILNSLDGSWAVRLSGFAVRIACTNQLYAETGNVVEWRELHISTGADLLGQLEKAVYDFLGSFEGALEPYGRAMSEGMLAEEVEPALVAQGLPQLHAGNIGARVEAESSHVGTTSRWGAYQTATSYLTREVQVNPDRERLFERAAARALLLPSGGSAPATAAT